MRRHFVYLIKIQLIETNHSTSFLFRTVSHDRTMIGIYAKQILYHLHIPKIHRISCNDERTIM